MIDFLTCSSLVVADVTLVVAAAVASASGAVYGARLALYP